MSRIDWTERAHGDLRAIHAYIARDSKRYADGVISRIKARTRRLRAWPLSGSIVPEWNAPDLREVYSGQYRIVYRVETDRVLILTVLHGARSFPEDP
jgi:toxin ParE1/3/4